MDISIVIVNWNTKDLLLNCIESVYSHMGSLSCEIWVVDNGSQDKSAEAVRSRFPDVLLIENRQNAGFAKANNQALRQINGRYAVLLNSDAVLTAGAIETMIGFMEKNRAAGICGGQLLNANGSKQNSIANIPTLATEMLNKSILRKLFPGKYPGKELNLRGPIVVESVIGACMVVRKEAMDNVGLLNEDYYFFLEETDWCLRFKRKGWKVYHHPEAKIYHYQGQSAAKVHINARLEYWKSRYLFFKKNHGIVTYYTLRSFLALKLIADIFLALVVNLVTFFGNRRAVGKLELYTALAVWHLKGMPDDSGLIKEP